MSVAKYYDKITHTWKKIQDTIGVFSFNGRTGSVSLQSSDVTGALGFTPPMQSDIQSLEQSKADKTALAPKLDKPTTAPTATGKILKVLTVNPDGTFTCEWGDAPDTMPLVDATQGESIPKSNGIKGVSVAGTAITPVNGIADIPKGTADRCGVVTTSNPNALYGLQISNDGVISTYRAQNADINLRSNYFRPITSSNLNYAVKAALSDSNRDTTYTAEQKRNACDTIGAVYDGEFELIEQVVLDEECTIFERLNEPNGDAYNFKKLFVTTQYNDLATANVSCHIRAKQFGSSTFNDIISTSIASKDKKPTYASYLLQIIGNRLMADAISSFAYSDNTNTSYRNARSFGLYPCKVINGFQLKAAYSGTVIPVGTKILIYGVRA